jgi:hypothetical protein
MLEGKVAVNQVGYSYTKIKHRERFVFLRTTIVPCTFRGRRAPICRIHVSRTKLIFKIIT